MIRIAVIILGVFLSFAANAQTIRLEGYRHPKNDHERALMKFYLKGLIDAFVLYNGLATTVQTTPEIFWTLFGTPNDKAGTLQWLNSSIKTLIAIRQGMPR